MNIIAIRQRGSGIGCGDNPTNNNNIASKEGNIPNVLLSYHHNNNNNNNNNNDNIAIHIVSEHRYYR